MCFPIGWPTQIRLEVYLIHFGYFQFSIRDRVCDTEIERQHKKYLCCGAADSMDCFQLSTHMLSTSYGAGSVAGVVAGCSKTTFASRVVVIVCLTCRL